MLNDSTEEVLYIVDVFATSEGLTASAAMTFTSHVPLMALHCTLTWNTNGTDVDFWINDPMGENAIMLITRQQVV